MKKMIALVTLFGLIVCSQVSYAQESSKEDKLVAISKVLLANSKQLDTIESELLKIVKNKNDSSVDSRKTTLTLLMIIDNIVTICNYEANLLQLSKFVEGTRKTKYFLWSGKRLEDSKDKLNSLFNIIQSNYKYVAYAPSVQLIDKSKEPIQSSVKLLENCIDLLEANRGIHFLE